LGRIRFEEEWDMTAGSNDILGKLENDNNRCSALLAILNTSTAQMADIRREEFSWLKGFLLFYSALTAWGVHSWLSEPLQETSDEVVLGWTTVVISSTATLAFSYLFLRIRHSYYMVAERVKHFQDMLGMYNKESWFGVAPMSRGNRIGDVTGIVSWHENTKPFQGFLMRVCYMCAANLVVILVSSVAILGGIANISCGTVILAVVINLLIALTIMALDYRILKSYSARVNT